MNTIPHQPRLSVVIVVHDGAAYLADAIESVRAQTSPAFEIIVVDDGSTDGSAEVAERFPDVRVIRQAFSGVAVARNRGLLACRGDVVAFVDADDRCRPERFAAQVAFLLAHPDVPCCVCHSLDFLDPSLTAPPDWYQLGHLDTPLPGYGTGTLMAWRSLFDEIGDFDASYPLGEDTEWLARVKASGRRIGLVPTVLLNRRIHGRNLTEHVALRQEVWFRIHRAQARWYLKRWDREGAPPVDAPGAVAVVIPAYNARTTLADAVESVLRQTRPISEIVVVDDGSTDGTSAVAARYRPHVRLVRQANAGQGAARNTGLDATRAPWILFLDADDRLELSALATLMDVRDAEPELDMVGCRLVQVPASRWADVVEGHTTADLEVMRAVGPGFLIRRAALERVGPFSNELRVAEFVDWLLRAEEAGLRQKTTAAILWRRLHAGNLGRRQRHAYGDYARVIKAALDRRRASGVLGAGRELT